MPGYLVDEGGERTHVVVPVEEYERLRRAAEKLETVREHANEIMAVISRGNLQTPSPDAAPPPRTPSLARGDVPPEKEAATPETPSENPQRGYGWQK
ncbi:hypothetical protein [Rubrobacter indicoceani]|uniref:hypothetical protein n=1 Tax=Rubrobacter indicoceani TaxID=2051957 RepID=UPI000E5A29CD|nr:hypothetical protein [Rubrobacter indicoceani]